MPLEPRRGALSHLLRLFAGRGADNPVGRAIRETTDTGHERAASVLRTDSNDPEFFYFNNGNENTVRIPPEHVDDLVLPDPLYRGPRTAASIHTHPENNPVLPSYGDSGFMDRFIRAETPAGSDINLGIFGAGATSGDAYLLRMLDRPTARMLDSVHNGRNELFNAINSAHSRDSRLANLIQNDPFGDDFLHEYSSANLGPTIRHMRMVRDNPENMEIGWNFRDRDQRNFYDDMFDAIVNRGYSEGGSVEPDSRFTDRPMPVAIPEFARVGPRGMNPPNHVEISPRGVADPRTDSYGPINWERLGRNSLAAIIGAIPGGESAMYGAGFNHDGAARSWPNAIARDTVNAATWPLGFLSGLIGGSVGDIVADGVIDAYENYRPVSRAQLNSYERDHRRFNEPGRRRQNLERETAQILRELRGSGNE